MKYEWPCITVLVLCTGAVFISNSAHTAAFGGWFFLLCGALFLGYIISTGIYLKKHRTDDNILDHRTHVAVFTAMLLMGIIGIEVAVRKSGGLSGDYWFFGFHLTLAIIAAVTFVYARFQHTGMTNPKYHRIFVYCFIGSYLASFTTGTMLVFNRFTFS